MIPLVDVLIVALPLTPETYHFLGEKELSLMKEGAFLFSIGRGKTIDEAALTKCLKPGKLGRYSMSLKPNPSLRRVSSGNLDNVIITPHVSGINIPEEICEEFIRNYKRWVKGKPLIGLVDRNRGY